MNSFKLFIALIIYVLAVPNFVKSQNLTDFYDVLPNIQNCQSGVMKQSVRDEILQYVNQIREIHGLNPVSYEMSGEAAAMEASLISTANGTITHNPPSNFACYSELGKIGCEKSNLYYYASFGSSNLIPTKESIVGWMIDENVENLGHRRSIINPFLTKIAFGRVDGKPKAGQNQNFDFSCMSLKYQDYVNGQTTVDYLAYPYNNYPVELFQADWYLSFSAIANKTNWGGNFNQVNYANAKVTMKVKETGSNVSVSALKFDNQGWGSLGNNIQWKAANLQQKVEYEVTVADVSVNGNNRSFTYSFTWGGASVVNPPSAPKLLLPSNNSQNLPFQVLRLEWEATDNATSYTVNLWSDGNTFERTIENISELYAEILNLPEGTNFNWRVKAINDGGESDWSEIFKFRTIVQLPNRLSLISPQNTQTLEFRNITFVFSGDINATSYEMEMSDSENFQDYTVHYLTEIETEYKPEIDVTLDISELEMSHSITYYWRARAINEAGESDWSDTYSFLMLDPASVRIQNENRIYNIANFGDGKYEIKFSERLTNVTLAISDMIGNVILLDKIESIENYSIDLNNEKISSGIYFLELIYSDSKHTILLNYTK